MKRHLRLAGMTAVAAALVTCVCLLVPLLFPSQWLTTNWRTWLGGTEEFVVRDGEMAHLLRYGFRFESVGRYAPYAVRVTIELDEHPLWTDTESVPTRDAALQRIRTAFVKDCYDSALPELAESFDTAWDSPGHTSLYEFPHRRLVNGVLWIAVVLGWSAATVLAATVIAMLWLIPQWFAARRRDRRGLCVYCGYDLSGTIGGRCPECGN